MNFVSFFLFINPPCSAAAQWMVIKRISEVRSTIDPEISPSPSP